MQKGCNLKTYKNMQKSGKKREGVRTVVNKRSHKSGRTCKIEQREVQTWRKHPLVRPPSSSGKKTPRFHALKLVMLGEGECRAKNKNMQNHVMPKSSNAKKNVQNELLLRPVHTCTPCSNSIFQRKTVRNKLPRPYLHRSGGCAATKKNWARKKRMASWARQRQQITEAADGGAGLARGRMVPSC